MIIIKPITSTFISINSKQDQSYEILNKQIVPLKPLKKTLSTQSTPVKCK